MRPLNVLRAVFLPLVVGVAAWTTGCNRCGQNEQLQDGQCVRPCNNSRECTGEEECVDGTCRPAHATSDGGSTGSSSSTGATSLPAPSSSASAGTSSGIATSSATSLVAALSSSSTTASSAAPASSSATPSSGPVSASSAPGSSSFAASSAGTASSSPAVPSSSSSAAPSSSEAGTSSAPSSSSGPSSSSSLPSSSSGSGLAPFLVLVSKNILAVNNNTSLTLTAGTPTGTQPGDLLIAVTASSNRAGVHTGTGFTTLLVSGGPTASAGANKTTVLYRVVPNPPPTSQDFTIGFGYGATVYLGLFAFRPVSGTLNMSSYGDHAEYTTYQSGTVLTAPAVTATQPGMLFRVFTEVSPGGAVLDYTLGPDTVIDHSEVANSALVLARPVDMGTQPEMALNMSPSASWQAASFVIGLY